jgi:hypothetical protein
MSSIKNTLDLSFWSSSKKVEDQTLEEYVSKLDDDISSIPPTYQENPVTRSNPLLGSRVFLVLLRRLYGG